MISIDVLLIPPGLESKKATFSNPYECAMVYTWSLQLVISPLLPSSSGFPYPWCGWDGWQEPLKIYHLLTLASTWHSIMPSCRREDVYLWPGFLPVHPRMRRPFRPDRSTEVARVTHGWPKICDGRDCLKQRCQDTATKQKQWAEKCGWMGHQ